MKFLLRVLVLAGFLLLSGVAHADNWPQWRGANHDGISTETNLPTEWSTTKNVLWKVTLPGKGSSTPAVWDKHLFITCQDGKDLVLMAYSTEGKELWKRKLGSGLRNARDEGNDASPSCCTDGKLVFALIGTGDFSAFDFDGKEVWRYNAQDRYGKFNIQFGMHSTPVLHGDKLYMQLMHTDGNWVMAVDKNTGKDVWKVERKSDGRDECLHSYASPCLWQNGKEALLIAHGNDYTTAHSLQDGSEVWRVGDLNPKSRYNNTLRFVASPVATPELVVVPTAKNGAVVAVKPDAKGTFGAGSKHEQWRMPNNTPDVPSPLVHEGYVYLCRENGVLLCLDAKTGKVHYQQRVHNQIHRASPVFADNKVYLTARDGTVTVVQPGPTFKLLATNKLPDRLNASPAISNGRIYLRGWDSLYAIGEK